METFSALLALCVGNSLVTGEFPSQRPVTQSFDVFFDLCLNQQLSKQWRWQWFQTSPHSLWRYCNVVMPHDIIYLHCFPPWASYQMRKIAGCACAGNAGNDFPATDFKGNHQLVIPACITARVSRTCRDACRDRLTRGGGENVPGIPGACATRKFTYLARGPWLVAWSPSKHRLIQW